MPRAADEQCCYWTGQDMKKVRRLKVPEEAYKDGPDGLKIYDMKLGDGALAQVRFPCFGALTNLSYTLCWNFLCSSLDTRSHQRRCCAHSPRSFPAAGLVDHNAHCNSDMVVWPHSS